MSPCKGVRKISNTMMTTNTAQTTGIKNPAIQNKLPHVLNTSFPKPQHGKSKGTINGPKSITKQLRIRI